MKYYGIVKGINTNSEYLNIQVELDIDNYKKDIINIKCDKELGSKIERNIIYEFDVEMINNKNVLKNYIKIDFLNDSIRDKYLRKYLNFSVLSYDDSFKELSNYVSAIENDVLRNITKEIINKSIYDILTYPGGSKLHHNYVGGLVYHIICMLRIGKSMLEIYPYLSKSLMYSGIILHDLGKIYEYQDIQNPEFSLDGHLIGHLVRGSLEVEKTASKLGYEGKEEVLLLEHILISHHGQLAFGSAKKPIIPEALMIWYIDSIDSKFDTLGKVYEQTENGNFTDIIPVCDKTKFYKHSVK